MGAQARQAWPGSRAPQPGGRWRAFQSTKPPTQVHKRARVDVDPAYPPCVSQMSGRGVKGALGRASADKAKDAEDGGVS